MDRLED